MEEIILVCTSQCIHVLVVRSSMSSNGYMARIADECAVLPHVGKQPSQSQLGVTKSRCRLSIPPRLINDPLKTCRRVGQRVQDT